MTRYQHLATLLAERIEQGLYRHGEKLPSVRSLSQEARRQHQHRATGVSDAGNDEAHHSAAAFGLFCRTT